jgi:hypothetical protein
MIPDLLKLVNILIYHMEKNHNLPIMPWIKLKLVYKLLPIPILCPKMIFVDFVMFLLYFFFIMLERKFLRRKGNDKCLSIEKYVNSFYDKLIIQIKNAYNK